MTPEGEPIPIACSLGAGSLAERIDKWRGSSRRRSSTPTPTPTPTSVRTVPDDAPAALTAAASLGQREKRCCAFFDVAIGLGADSRTLSLTVPGGTEEALAALVVLLTS